MSITEEIKYGVDFCPRGKGRRNNKTFSSPQPPSEVPAASYSIPRIARLMALAIRYDRLLRAEEFRDYAELARVGRVTRARMTQIMKLLDLAPDIQEQILFRPNLKGLTERNLRPIVSGSTGTSRDPCFTRSWAVRNAGGRPRSNHLHQAASITY
jgi:hypothetical protein